MNRLTTAAEVIDALGGTQAVAALLGVGASAVSNYRRLGFPARAHYRLANACAQNGLNVAEAVFGGLRQNGGHPPDRTASRRTGVREAPFSERLSQFVEAGYTPVTLPVLQPAGPFVDRMGAEMQRRLFTFTDPAGEQLCLRPDLTIPAALEHLRLGGNGESRYCYQGTAFRYQPRGSGKPEEFTQLGIELIGEASEDVQTDDDRRTGEAEVFGQILSVILEAGVTDCEIRFNDTSHLANLVDDYAFSDAFKTLLKRRLLQGDRMEDIKQAFPTLRRNAAGQARPPRIGFAETDNIAGRTGAEIMARLARKQDEQSSNEADLSELDKMMAGLEKKSGSGGRELPDYGRHLAEKADALGCPADRVAHDPDLGQKMAYYTGLFFEIHVPRLEERRVIASGGRYDDLLNSLGAPRPMPAIGGAIALERLQEAGS